MIHVYDEQMMHDSTDKRLRAYYDNMTRAYDVMYLEGAMVRLGDMLEYACLDCEYDSDAFWKMFIHSGVARRFETGDVSIVAGRSGPELCYIVLDRVEHRDCFPIPVWREERSELFWSGWVLAYFQWFVNKPFYEIWESISMRMLQKMYKTLHETDVMKVVEVLNKMMQHPEKTSIKNLRLIRNMTQKQLAIRANMTVAQLQRIEYGERKVENLTLKTGIALASALGVKVEELIEYAPCLTDAK